MRIPLTAEISLSEAFVGICEEHCPFFKKNLQAEHTMKLDMFSLWHNLLNSLKL